MEKRQGGGGGPTQLSSLALGRYLYKERLPWKPLLLNPGTVGHQFGVSPVSCWGSFPFNIRNGGSPV